MCGLILQSTTPEEFTREPGTDLSVGVHDARGLTSVQIFRRYVPHSTQGGTLPSCHR